jgi:hypothetical protein
MSTGNSRALASASRRSGRSTLSGGRRTFIAPGIDAHRLGSRRVVRKSYTAYQIAHGGYALACPENVEHMFS